MRLITIEEQIAVVEKVHKANVWLATAYPGTKRVVCLKTERVGMTVYVHGEDLKVINCLSVDPYEFDYTVDAALADVHAVLDVIIKECDERRADLFFGEMAGSSQEATAELYTY